jgi:aminomethyltransferase
MEQTKRTLLYEYHLAKGANMGTFGGYEMPLWYKNGAKAEHLAVILRAGLFDTSHMAAITVKGGAARSLLQYCVSKDLEKCIADGPLTAGRCVYGVFLLPDGSVLDDAIIYQLGDNLYLVVVNAGMGEKVTAHLQAQNYDVIVEDLSGRFGKIDIQGPWSARILQKILKDPNQIFEGMVYFSFKGGFGDIAGTGSVELSDGSPILLSRTGYTGEFGFELYCDLPYLSKLWHMILSAGSDDGMLVCGLAARDSLRAGAMLPLSHQDIGAWPFLNNPWQFALPWAADGKSFTKHFLGAEGLLKSDWREYTLPFAGFDPRKIVAGENGAVLNLAGERIGTILTCTTDMAIDRVEGHIVSISGDRSLQPRGLSCGFVRVNNICKPREQLILSDGKRNVQMEIRADVRPNRTARAAMKTMLLK